MCVIKNQNRTDKLTNVFKFDDTYNNKYWRKNGKNMKIVQSFILHEKNIPYSFKNGDNVILNFYSFLLSFITLKQKYDNVIAVVNKCAYDLFMKYIPYDEFIFVDDYPIDYKKYWSLVKVNILKEIEAPLIHVDGDVMIFNELFSDFIYDNNYDIIVQNIECKEFDTHYLKYDKLLEKILMIKNIFKENVKDINPLNCGVIGFKSDVVKNKFIVKVNQIYNVVNGSFFEKYLDNQFPIYLEQHTLGVIVSELELKPYAILNTDNEKRTLMDIGNDIGYTHLWLDRKYNPDIIKKIKQKILVDYNDYYYSVSDFEKNNE